MITKPTNRTKGHTMPNGFTAEYIANLRMGSGGARARDFLGTAGVNALLANESVQLLWRSMNPTNGYSAEMNLRKAASRLEQALADVQAVIAQLDAPAVELEVDVIDEALALGQCGD